VSCIIRCARTLHCDPEISGYNSRSKFDGKALWEETITNNESIINNSQVLSVLDNLESIVVHNRSKPRIVIKPKEDKLKITIHKQ